MQPSRFQSITARFSPHNLRTSFRRSSTSSSSASSRASSTSSNDRASFVSATSSPVSAINGIVSRQKLALDHDERAPHILEPRPAATFCSLEERMLSF